MTGSGGRSGGIRPRLVPAVLAVVGILLVGWIFVAVVDPTPQETPAELRLLLLVPAAILVLVGAALTIDPRPLPVRRALAGPALLWLFFLAAVTGIRAGQGRIDLYLLGAAVLVAVIGGALLALLATTPEVTDEELPELLGRLAATVTFSIAILVAAVVLVLVTTFIAWGRRGPSRRGRFRRACHGGRSSSSSSSRS